MLPMMLSEVADLVSGELVRGGDIRIDGAAGLADAGPGMITYAARAGRLVEAESSGAAAVLIGPDMETEMAAIRVVDPQRAFVKILGLMCPDPDRHFPPGVHQTAVVDQGADVAGAISIGPYCVIADGVVLAEGCRLGPHVTLGCDVSVGRDTLIHAQVAIREGCRIGERVIIHSGAVIGSDGFGYLSAKNGMEKIPQLGIVQIGDDVEIGAGAAIDRATTGKTVIGPGTKIDNLVQVGHNVTVGRACALSAQTGVSGSCELEDGVVCGGQVGIGDHLKVGAGTHLGGQSGVVGNLPAGSRVFGTPALDIKESMRIAAALRRLPDLLKTVKHLSDRVESLKDDPGDRMDD